MTSHPNVRARGIESRGFHVDALTQKIPPLFAKRLNRGDNPKSSLRFAEDKSFQRVDFVCLRGTRDVRVRPRSTTRRSRLTRTLCIGYSVSQSRLGALNAAIPAGLPAESSGGGDADYRI